MANEAQVSCINKTNRTSAHERIHSIGGVTGGKRWKLTQLEAIATIKSGQWRFYTADSHGRKVYVIVAVSRFGNEYIKTESDGEHPDNLLSLPECP